MRGLKEENAIRTEYHFTKSGRKLLVYIYNCKDCGKEIRPRQQQLKNCTGKCQSCCHKIEKFKVRFNFLKERCKQGNIKRSLSFNDYLEFTKINNCYYCNIEIDWTTKTHSYGGKAYYLDRKNSNIGYTKENCVVCCSQCNRMKMSLSSKEFIEKCKKIAYNKKIG